MSICLNGDGSFIMMVGSTSGRHAHTDGLSASFDAFLAFCHSQR